MDAFLSIAFAVQVLRISVPYVLASLGGTISERGGVVNIAMEGLMLSGAFAFVLGAWATGSAAGGIVAGLAGGMAVAAVFAVAVLHFRADPVVCGVAINLLAAGLTRFLLKLLWGSSSNSCRVETFGPLLAGDGAVAQMLGPLTHPLFLAALALVAMTQVLLFRTPFGLRLRACGEHPAAAESVGVRVARMRWWGLLASGALAAMGGMWLAVENHQFTDNMTAGRGYIALAAMIFGRWRPVGAALACLCFGLAEAVQITLQGQGTGVPAQFLQMMPYLLTIATLVWMGWRRGRAKVRCR